MTCELENRSIIGSARDISLGGMFVESQEVPAFGAELTIVVRLPGTSADARLPGVVRWTEASGFGVQFGLLGARETHDIANLLKH